MTQVVLTLEGRPRNPKSIFVGVQKKLLPARALLEGLNVAEAPRLVLPFKFDGGWEVLDGHIVSIRWFPDGVLIEFPQDLERSTLKWSSAFLWMSNKGTGGILNYKTLGFPQHWQTSGTRKRKRRRKPKRR